MGVSQGQSLECESLIYTNMVVYTLGFRLYIVKFCKSCITYIMVNSRYDLMYATDHEGGRTLTSPTFTWETLQHFQV